MPRGRPPKPTRLKVLTGNPGRRHLNAGEPRPPSGAPTCPTWLDKEAKSEWRRVVPILDRLGLLSRVDRSAVAAYCTAWAELHWATVQLRKGRTYTTKEGQVCVHPAVGMQRSALQHVRQFAALFGLDPSSRGKLAVPGGQGEEAELNDFLNARGAS